MFSFVIIFHLVLSCLSSVRVCICFCMSVFHCICLVCVLVCNFYGPCCPRQIINKILKNIWQINDWLVWWICQRTWTWLTVIDCTTTCITVEPSSTLAAVFTFSVVLAVLIHFHTLYWHFLPAHSPLIATLSLAARKLLFATLVAHYAKRR